MIFLYALHRQYEKMRNMKKSLLLKRIALRALKNAGTLIFGVLQF